MVFSSVGITALEGIEAARGAAGVLLLLGLELLFAGALRLELSGLELSDLGGGVFVTVGFLTAAVVLALVFETGEAFDVLAVTVLVSVLAVLGFALGVFSFFTGSLITDSFLAGVDFATALEAFGWDFDTSRSALFATALTGADFVPLADFVPTALATTTFATVLCVAPALLATVLPAPTLLAPAFDGLGTALTAARVLAELGLDAFAPDTFTACDFAFDDRDAAEATIIKVLRFLMSCSV